MIVYVLSVSLDKQLKVYCKEHCANIDLLSITSFFAYLFQCI